MSVNLIIFLFLVFLFYSILRLYLKNVANSGRSDRISWDPRRGPRQAKHRQFGYNLLHCGKLFILYNVFYNDTYLIRLWMISDYPREGMKITLSAYRILLKDFLSLINPLIMMREGVNSSFKFKPLITEILARVLWLQWAFVSRMLMTRIPYFLRMSTEQRYRKQLRSR